MAGKGPGRRKGSVDKKYREGYSMIKGFDHSKDIDKNFEEKFMGKEASETRIPTGKYFMG